MASDQPEADLTDQSDAATTGSRQSHRLLVLAMGLVVTVSAIAAAVARLRRRRQPPPTQAERLAARARAASLTLQARRGQIAASTTPLLQTSRRLSVAAAQRAAMQAAAAAQQASTLAAIARATRLPGGSRAGEVDPTIAPIGTQQRERPSRVAGALKTAATFGAGYVVGSRAGRKRFEQLKQASSTWAQRPQVQQSRQRLQTGVTHTLQAGNARLSHSTAGVTAKLHRRSGSNDHPLTAANDSANTASDNGQRSDSPDNQ
jgi:hypothetical protein